MNRRKPRRALSRDDVDEILDAFHHARRIGLPLNVMVTVLFAATDTMTVSERCQGYDRVKNIIGQFARRHGFDTANLWTREVDPDGKGEHIHLFCYVPPALYRRFTLCATTWCSGATEIDVRQTSQTSTLANDGRRHSAPHDIAKQMSPQAAFKRPIRRMKGGIIEGQRGGCSRICGDSGASDVARPSAGPGVCCRFFDATIPRMTLAIIYGVGGGKMFRWFGLGTGGEHY